VKTLILGGIRSGKSRLAESLALKSGLPVTCIATATAADSEMRARIAAHRSRRPSDWLVIEEPLALATALRARSPTGCVIVDCLTLWLTNLLVADDDGLFDRECDALLQALPELPGTVIFVSNETNLGIVPADSLSRRFCDEAGRLHQRLAQCCERVVLTVAGLPFALKGAPP
jgi:adenosylcobinamide kinase/adenosylcobinamide-phosphate guanylyltransferase